MKNGILPLWQPGEEAVGDFMPTLEPVLHPQGGRRGAVIVCPGGGYGGRADYEGKPIAEAFVAAGMHAFVLEYRVEPQRHPAPIRDAARAMRMVRQRAAEWGVRPDHVAICGFSAGGHLAGSLGVHYDKPWMDGGAAVDQLSARPDACVLCYPVISSGPNAHQGSFQNLLGPGATAEQLAMMSLENHVTAQTPPAFLWHTANDDAVPVQNPLLYAGALAAHQVPFELHIYPSGPHGLALAADQPHVATWMPLCCEWLKAMGW